jgi:ribonuclease HI
LAKHVWRLLNLEAERTYLAAIPDAYGDVEYILKQQELKRELMVIALWFLWSERNSIREEGRRRPAEVLARCIEMYMHENVQISSSTPAHSNLRRKNWTRPPNNVLKLNVDGSFRLENMAGSWGFLIRDSDGDLVLVGRGRVDNLLSAFQSVLIACLQGLQSAADLGIGQLILETDAQEVVSALNSTVYDDSVLGHLIEEIKFQARLNFTSFVCIHVSRSCNQAAHELASLGYLCSEGNGVIADSVPENITVIVANDLLANE